MTYRLKALVSTVILSPILGGLQLKIFALDFFQRCGTTWYIIEWTVSYLVNSVREGKNAFSAIFYVKIILKF